MLSFYVYIQFGPFRNGELKVFKVYLLFGFFFTKLFRIFANLQTKVVRDPKTL